MESNNRNYGAIKLSLAMVIMGTVGFFVLEAQQPPQNIVFFRCLFGVLSMAPYCFFMGMFKDTGITKKKFILLILSGVFLVCNWIMLFKSFKYSSIAVSTTIYHIQPFIFVAIWSLVNKEKIQPEKFIYMIFAFIGVIFVIDISMNEFQASSNYFVGALLSLAAALFWAISATMVKLIQGVKPYITVLIQMIVGVVTILPFVDFSQTSSVSGLQIGYLITLGVVHSCVVYVLMYSSYKTLRAPLIAILTFIYPIVAILLDVVVYGKVLSAIQIGGILMILVSSYASTRNIQIFKKKVSST